MLFYVAKSPTDYQEIFFRQIGLEKTKKNEQEFLWSDSKNNMVHSYGSMDQIQCGIGCYTVNSNFLVEYQYDSSYLHFGIIHEGITYSLVENKLEAHSVPSPFLSLQKASGGINCWKKGQHFKGVEISIEINYLKNVLLPFLGVSENALEFLEENVKYLHLPEEMKHLIVRIEDLLKKSEMTMPLQMSLCLEFISLLIHPKNRDVFNYRQKIFSKYLSLGERKIKISKEDFQKIILAHDKIKKDASSFVTIYELSKELGISEQKLKAGFKEMYQQTIWDHANNVRMNMAVNLLIDTELSINEISKKIGYQSQAAFITMFKKWCGVTPGQFRVQMHSQDHLK